MIPSVLPYARGRASNKLPILSVKPMIVHVK
jgi:hypothetical protein